MDDAKNFYAKVHSIDKDYLAVEIRPLLGRWYPVVIGIPNNENIELTERDIRVGIIDSPNTSELVYSEIVEKNVEDAPFGKAITFVIFRKSMPDISFYIFFRKDKVPTEMIFGQAGKIPTYYIRNIKA